MSRPVPTITTDKTCEAISAFTLSVPDARWIVRRGELNIFAARTDEHRHAPALHWLFTLREGEAAFGINVRRPCPVTLLGKPASDTGLVMQSVSSAGQRWGDADDDAAEQRWLARWVAALSMAALKTPAPIGADCLQPGSTLMLDERSRSFVPSPSLVWVRQRAGCCRLGGRSEMTITPATPPYPVSRSTWLEAEPYSEFSVLDPSSPDDEPLQADLERFHTDVLACIDRDIVAADALERDRLRRSREVDRTAVSGAIEMLASSLITRAAAWSPSVSSDDAQGIRALQAIGQALGVTIKPSRQRLRGVTPVTAIADASGIRYRRVSLKGAWHRSCNEPLLAFRGRDRVPTALLPRRGRSRNGWFDPDRRTLSALSASAATAFGSLAFMFYRTFPRKSLSIGDLVRFALRGSRREWFTLLMVALASGVLALVPPVVARVAFDSAIPNGSRGDLVMVGGLVLLAAGAAELFNVTRGLAALRLQGKLALALDAAVWDRLLSLPLRFFRHYAVGDLAERVDAFSRVRTRLTGSAFDALGAGIVSAVSAGLLVHYSPRLSLVAVVTTMVAAAASLSASVPQVKLRRQIRASHGAIKGMLFNVFRGIAKFRLASAERRVFALWASEYGAQRRADVGAREMISRWKVSSATCAVAGTAVLCVVNTNAQRLGEHALSTGTFLAFMLAFGQLLSSMLTMTAAVAGVADVVASYERAAPILRAVPEDTAAPKVEVELEGDIEVQNVFFGYSPDAAPVLRDVSFHITPGEYVALVGRSGCGKSTLFRLLLGFEAPASGSIAYNGVDLRDLDLHSVRRQVGVVLQSGTLLTGTISDNISGAARLPMEEVWEAARLVGLDDDIRSMPMGMQTLVSATGAGLSGGQRQRVLLARAVARKPRVLLFDEPTSALDNRMQATVSERLKTLNATRIVIAHRLTTILNADRILVMDRGRIVQSGTPTELMAQVGPFRQLAERQAI